MVPEGDLHTRRSVELVVALRHWLATRPDGDSAWVCHSINVYYREGDPRSVACPDVAVAFGVNVAAVAGAGSYKVWEAGAAPVFVLEIASPSTVRIDEVDKPRTYAAMGVAEYWRVDPQDGELFTPPLRGARRVTDRWEAITVAADNDGVLRGTSDVLGLELCWQPPKLRLYDPAAGAWLRDPDDLLTAATRADREAIARQAAQAEAAELRRRLEQYESPTGGPER